MDARGAPGLCAGRIPCAATGKKASPAPPLPTATDGALLTPEQIEARLVAAIQVSVDDQRDLIKRWAQAVQSYILKTGQVAPERLSIITPESATAPVTGKPRANLSLD